ncbi:MAG: choice-of-anchor tandem repeat GloVer-containing protein [Candidatus Tumulicola sp.]
MWILQHWMRTAFRLLPSSNGYKEQVIHRFGSGGIYPETGLTFGPGGNLFGTTSFGGKGKCSIPPPSALFGCRVIFELLPQGGDYHEKVIYSFTKMQAEKGIWPASPLTVGSDASMYGTTLEGGDPACDPSPSGAGGCGTVYRLAPSGAVDVLFQFRGGKYGSEPAAPLFYFHGALYGETLADGTNGYGTTFKLHL